MINRFLWFSYRRILLLHPRIVAWVLQNLENGIRKTKLKKTRAIVCFRFGANIRHADAGQYRNVRIPDATAREQNTAETGGCEKA